MSYSLDDNRREKIKKKLEKDHGINIDSLQKISRNIREKFDNSHYIIFNEYREKPFVDVVARSMYIEYDKCSTLAEKCMARANWIKRKRLSFEDNEKIYDEILDMETLWLVIGEICSFELLWGMEISGVYHIDESKISKHNKTQIAFEYLYDKANFYLSFTEDFVEKLQNQLDDKQKLLLKK